jgi:tryptophan synthase alpha chain
VSGSRIANRFDLLEKEGRSGLVTFLTAGDPNFEISLQTLRELPASGADVIELGMPFSDPMADGPAIQASSQRALKAGIDLKKIFSIVEIFRSEDTETPIVLMGYFNPIYIYGIEAFISDAESAGVDGLIIVDLPPEEPELLHIMENSSLQFIYLITPTTNDERLPKIIKHASGFIYYVSVTGITGTKTASSEHVELALSRIRRYTDLPIAVGFGIKTPEQATKMAKYADAAVVGSALVSRIEDNLDANGKPTSACVTAVLDFVGQISEGIRSISKNAQENATE